jgi:hypothetical protein
MKNFFVCILDGSTLDLAFASTHMFMILNL